MSHFEMIELTMCLKGFRHAHAAAARMCLACYFLQGIMALAGAQTLLKQFEERAKVAREAPIDRNVEKPLFFWIQHARFLETVRPRLAPRTAGVRAGVSIETRPAPGVSPSTS